LARKPPGGKRKAGKPGTGAKPKRDNHGGGSAGSAHTVRARKLSAEGVWELVHPRCARDRQEDLEEVRKMLDAGELEVAVDECRWLLNGCSDCLEAHRLLGEIALSENDWPLARGHFGYAYRLGEKALQQAGTKGPLPYRLGANHSFLESGKGLAFCLRQLGKREMAKEVVEALLACDSSDPLGVKGWLIADPPITGPEKS
jgi:hypothetical protein